MKRLQVRMSGPTCVCIVVSVSPASLTRACAAFRSDSAFARLWRAWVSVAVVYAVFPNVNDPFGKCFSMPAMSACTCVKTVALLGFDWDVDMVLVLLSEGARRRIGDPARKCSAWVLTPFFVPHRDSPGSI